MRTVIKTWPLRLQVGLGGPIPQVREVERVLNEVGRSLGLGPLIGSQERVRRVLLESEEERRVTTDKEN